MFNYKHLALAVASIGAASAANAAGLDRSGQDVTAFLQDGTYAEAVYTYIDPDISGYDNATGSTATPIGGYTKGNATGDISEDYDFFRFGIKADINDRFSVGVLYDEPFGASIKHSGNSSFISNGVDDLITVLSNGRQDALSTASSNLNAVNAGITQIQAGITQLQAGIDATQAAGGDATALQAQLSGLQTQLTQLQAQQGNLTQLVGAGAALSPALDGQIGQGTNVEIRTNNLTALVGAKFGKNKNFQVYGGPALQRLTGEVHLRGSAYQQATGYDARMSPDTAMGWVAGVMYSKPEIALKAALTYRSEIEHDTTIAEVFPALALRRVQPHQTQGFSVTLPDSYNLDFQTGISPTMLLTAKVRYVPWSDFTIEPTLYTATTGTPIISYDKDQWSAEIGLGKKLSDKVAVSGSVGYDSGAGNPISTLGPIKGYHSVGLGVRYNFTPEWSVSLGGKYLKFGDGTAVLPNKMMAGKFEDNDGFIAGLKVAYHAK